MAKTGTDAISKPHVLIDTETTTYIDAVIIKTEITGASEFERDLLAGKIKEFIGSLAADAHKANELQANELIKRFAATPKSMKSKK
jgi:hypothetical protein